MVDYVYIGCTIGFVLMVSAMLVATIVSIVRDHRDPQSVLKPRPPEVLNLTAHTHCRVARCEGRTLVIRTLGCMRCAELRIATRNHFSFCHPVEASRAETVAIEELRREVNDVRVN